MADSAQQQKENLKRDPNYYTGSGGSPVPTGNQVGGQSVKGKSKQKSEQEKPQVLQQISAQEAVRRDIEQRTGLKTAIIDGQVVQSTSSGKRVTGYADVLNDETGRITRVGILETGETVDINQQKPKSTLSGTVVKDIFGNEKVVIQSVQPSDKGVFGGSNVVLRSEQPRDKNVVRGTVVKDVFGNEKVVMQSVQPKQEEKLYSELGIKDIERVERSKQKTQRTPLFGLTAEEQKDLENTPIVGSLIRQQQGYAEDTRLFLKNPLDFLKRSTENLDKETLGRGFIYVAGGKALQAVPIGGIRYLGLGLEGVGYTVAGRKISEAASQTKQEIKLEEKGINVDLNRLFTVGYQAEQKTDFGMFQNVIGEVPLIEDVPMIGQQFRSPREKVFSVAVLEELKSQNVPEEQRLDILKSLIAVRRTGEKGEVAGISAASGQIERSFQKNLANTGLKVFGDDLVKTVGKTSGAVQIRALPYGLVEGAAQEIAQKELTGTKIEEFKLIDVGQVGLGAVFGGVSTGAANKLVGDISILGVKRGGGATAKTSAEVQKALQKGQSYGEFAQNIVYATDPTELFGDVLAAQKTKGYRALGVTELTPEISFSSDQKGFTANVIATNTQTPATSINLQSNVNAMGFSNVVPTEAFEVVPISDSTKTPSDAFSIIPIKTNEQRQGQDTNININTFAFSNVLPVATNLQGGAFLPPLVPSLGLGSGAGSGKGRSNTDLTNELNNAFNDIFNNLQVPQTKGKKIKASKKVNDVLRIL